MSGGTFSALAHRGFRPLFLGNFLGNLGNALATVGAAWLLTELGEPADVVALTQSAASLPIMLLALPAGAVADAHDRRRVMLAAELAMLAVALVLALSGGAAVPAGLVIALTCAWAAGAAFYGPAAQASIGAVVPRAELAGAVSLSILAFNVARSLGPAAGGAVVALGGARTAFVAAALCYAGVALLVWRWRADQPRAGTPPPMLHSIGEGLRFVAGSPPVRTIVLRAITFTGAGSAAWALMPLVSRDMVGGGSVEFGLLLGALGLGAVIGALTATRVRQRFSSEAIIRGAGLIYGAACLAVALRPGLWPTLALLVVGGAGWVQALSGFSVAGQLWSPRPVIGRVSATVNSVTFGGIALGSWIWGHVAADHGVAAAIAGSGAAMVLLPLVGLALPMPRHEEAMAA